MTFKLLELLHVSPRKRFNLNVRRVTQNSYLQMNIQFILTRAFTFVLFINFFRHFYFSYILWYFLVSEEVCGLFLERAGMSSCKPASTPVDTTRNQVLTLVLLMKNPTLYRCLTGALQYLTFSRLDISYIMQHVCLFMHDPRVERMASLILHKC